MGLRTEGQLWGRGWHALRSGGQDDLGLETAFLSFFFETYLFYTEHFSNLCAILAGRRGPASLPRRSAVSAFAVAEASRDRESRAAPVFRVWPANFPGRGITWGSC